MHDGWPLSSPSRSRSPPSAPPPSPPPLSPPRPTPPPPSPSPPLHAHMRGGERQRSRAGSRSTHPHPSIARPPALSGRVTTVDVHQHVVRPPHRVLLESRGGACRDRQSSAGRKLVLALVCEGDAASVTGSAYPRGMSSRRPEPKPRLGSCLRPWKRCSRRGAQQRSNAAKRASPLDPLPPLAIFTPPTVSQKRMHSPQAAPWPSRG